MTVMRWKGHQAQVRFDADEGMFVGRLAGINDVVGFHADSVAGLAAAFEAAVTDYLAACRWSGKEPEKRYSGRLMVRISPMVHAEAALAAQLRGVSLNQWVEAVMYEAARKESKEFG